MQKALSDSFFIQHKHKINTMEQEKILSTLSEKLGETSFSPQTLQTYVELNPIAEGSEPDEAYWNKAVNFLKGMQGQYNHDVATRVEDFKKNYKPQPTPPTPPTPPVPPKNDDELEKKLKELEARLDAVTDAVAGGSVVGLRMTMTVIPIIGLLIAVFYFHRKYILTEQKMEEITERIKESH